MWGWVGDPDPNSLLGFFTTDEIGGSSDSYYSNADYDDLYNEQRQESDEAARKEILSDMQNLVYDEAPYHILYYDAELHAYRTDKFGGWQNQPVEGGTPLFGYGSERLQPADRPGPGGLTAAVVRRASPGGRAATPAPSAGDGQPTSDSSSMLPLILAVSGPRRDHRRRPPRDARSTGNGRGGMTDAGGSPPVDPASPLRGSVVRRSPAGASGGAA